MISCISRVSPALRKRNHGIRTPASPIGRVIRDVMIFHDSCDLRGREWYLMHPGRNAASLTALIMFKLSYVLALVPISEYVQYTNTSP
jgi:hypothetical protein